jgi:hypothetical protein
MPETDQIVKVRAMGPCGTSRFKSPLVALLAPLLLHRIHTAKTLILGKVFPVGRNFLFKGVDSLTTTRLSDFEGR